jgi:Tol biopolymer transport system component
LAYVDRLRNVSIWRIPIDKHEQGEQFIASNFLDSAAEYSPDGTHIAFRSDRSGANEIWICRSDGKEPRPDGRWVAFDSRVAGRSAIHIVNVAGGSPIRITNGLFDAADNVVPNWSHDGRSLYFSSNRTGKWQIWRKRISDEGETQITKEGGFNGMESPNGLDLYYVRDASKTSIWRMSLNGGKSTQVLEALGPGMWGYWTISGRSLFYLQRKAMGSAPADIFRMDIVTGITEKLGKTQFDVNHDDKGIAISPDGRWLLYAQRDVDRSSIMLVDGWEP